MAKQSKTGAWYKSPRGSSIFATVMRFLIAVQILFLTTGCVRNPSATFRNPGFDCPSPNTVEGYYRTQQNDLAPRQISLAELKHLCAEMKHLFTDSNMTGGEAEQFYALLKEANGKRLSDGHILYFYNGTYGMPGPERPKPFVFEKQVMLRKITEEEYELFYYFIGCGRNYTYMTVYLENRNVARVTWAEMWRESYPC